MEKFNRIFLIVLDSVGIGEAPDADKYNDIGAHTLGNIAKYMQGLNLPNLAAFGLSNIEPIQGVPKATKPLSFYTKMQEASVGKDTMTGHWELMGLHIEKPFQTFPNGFPESLIDELSAKINRPIIGNKPASGTVIIEELGEEHMRTGAIIVYTSADSVLQIAAHEEVIPLDELYHICEIARQLTLREEYLVGRVIARPFIGEAGAFERTANRKDYALKPYGKTVLNTLQENNLEVISLGKIYDIYDGEGITHAVRTVNNDDGVDKLLEMLDKDFSGLCFLNLVDFDAKYGHRRDPVGYAKALERFDEQLPSIVNKLLSDDLLIITADHGNDPTFHGTDHTREFVPLFIYSKRFNNGGELTIRQSFADVGATIADNFKLPLPSHGKSMLQEIKDLL